jgi:hypothetical protein
LELAQHRSRFERAFGIIERDLSRSLILRNEQDDTSLTASKLVAMIAETGDVSGHDCPCTALAATAADCAPQFVYTLLGCLGVICPGFVKTPLVEKQIPEQALMRGDVAVDRRHYGDLDELERHWIAVLSGCALSPYSNDSLCTPAPVAVFDSYVDEITADQASYMSLAYQRPDRSDFNRERHHT